MFDLPSGVKRFLLVLVLGGVVEKELKPGCLYAIHSTISI
jgi:hypothetical protein